MLITLLTGNADTLTTLVKRPRVQLRGEVQLRGRVRLSGRVHK